MLLAVGRKRVGHQRSPKNLVSQSRGLRCSAFAWVLSFGVQLCDHSLLARTSAYKVQEDWKLQFGFFQQPPIHVYIYICTGSLAVIGL